MSALDIQEFSGLLAGPIVSALYEHEGNGIEIRESDLFFAGFVDGAVVASVRFCVEDGIPMLRTMRVAEAHQGHGFGLALLRQFERYLNRCGARGVWCQPYAHLDGFYGAIGFRRAPEDEAPKFLRERLLATRARGLNVILMKRD